MRRVAWLTIPSTVALAFACGGPSRDGGVTVQQACADEFEALVGLACNLTTPPADEVARIRGVFATVCQNALALPGTGYDAGSLESCAAAIVATGCTTTSVPECSPQGSLPEGAACSDAVQCRSGICQLGPVVISDGGASTAPCGTCAAGVAVGQPCATGDTCRYGSICAASGDGFACTPITYGDAGATCDGLAYECKTGLYCDRPSAQCTAPAGPGAPCATSQACSPPLVCSSGADGGGAGTCQDPAPAGAPCETDQDCATGLGCSLATSRCAALTWVSPGEPCGDLQRCVVGICPLTHGPNGPGPASGDCPLVVADGQPCTVGDSSHTCDTFSVCSGGVCRQPYSVACQ